MQVSHAIRLKAFMLASACMIAPVRGQVPGEVRPGPTNAEENAKFTEQALEKIKKLGSLTEEADDVDKVAEGVNDLAVARAKAEAIMNNPQNAFLPAIRVTPHPSTAQLVCVSPNATLATVVCDNDATYALYCSSGAFIPRNLGQEAPASQWSQYFCRGKQLQMTVGVWSDVPAHFRSVPGFVTSNENRVLTQGVVFVAPCVVSSRHDKVDCSPAGRLVRGLLGNAFKSSP